MHEPEPIQGTPTAGDPGLLNRIAWSIRWQDRAKSCEFAETANALAVGQSDAKGRADVGRARLTLAWQAKWRGAFDESLNRALEAERWLPEAQFPDERAYTYSILGVLHYSRGRLDLASCAVDRGFLLTDADREPAAFVDLLTTQASILRHKGDRGRAGLTLGRAEQLASGENEARVQHNISRWLLEDDCPDRAEERAARTLDLANQHKCRVIEPYAHEIMGEAKARLGHFDEAERCFETGLKIARSDDDVRVQCQILQAYGAMERKRGESAKALTLCQKGARLATKMNYVIWQQRFARQSAALYEERGELKAALAEHRVAWALSDKRRS